MKLNLNHALLPLFAVFLTALVATGGLYSINDNSDSSQLTGEVTGYKMFNIPSAKPAPRICAQVITHACEDRNPNNCRTFSNACLPPGWSRAPKLTRPEPISTEPVGELLPTPKPTVTQSKPSLAPIKPDLKKCIFNAKSRPCVPGRSTDQYGCRNCIKKVVR
ncbi:MAG: hypothetical protein AABX39_05775 [Nanoarchaeota archaeon]